MSSWEIKGILEGSAEDDMWVRQLYWLRDFQAGDLLTLSFLVCVKQTSCLDEAAGARKCLQITPPVFSRRLEGCVFM